MEIKWIVIQIIFSGKWVGIYGPLMFYSMKEMTE